MKLLRPKLFGPKKRNDAEFHRTQGYQTDLCDCFRCKGWVEARVPILVERLSGYTAPAAIAVRRAQFLTARDPASPGVSSSKLAVASKEVDKSLGCFH
jgi:hypothetical protein